MKTIPDIRERLNAIAIELLELDRGGAVDTLARELRDLAEETRRRAPIRRARNEHAPLTSSQIALIRQLRSSDPPMSQQHIAEMLGTNAGRVSEAERGFRDVA